MLPEQTLVLCFMVFGALVGYITNRITSDSANCIGATIITGLPGAIIGAFFTLVIVLVFTMDLAITGPNAIGREITKPVVFHENAKQCEFFIERKRNSYVVLEEK